MKERKFAINQATLMKTPMEDFLSATSKAGFTGVELRREETFEYLKEHSVADLKALLEQYNLEVVSWNAIELFSLCPKEEFQGMLEYSERLMNIGNEIGCELIIAVPSFVDDAVFPEDEYFDKTVERLQTLRKLADDYDFKMGFEPLGFSNCSVRKVDYALDILSESEKDGLGPSGLIIDTFHYFLAHSSLKPLETIPLEKLWLIHCNDSVEKPFKDLQDADRVLLGEGFFDLEGFFKKVKAMGYDGYYSVELFNEDLWDQNPGEVAKKALESLRKITSQLT